MQHTWHAACAACDRPYAEDSLRLIDNFNSLLSIHFALLTAEPVIETGFNLIFSYKECVRYCILLQVWHKQETQALVIPLTWLLWFAHKHMKHPIYTLKMIMSVCTCVASVTESQFTDAATLQLSTMSLTTLSKFVMCFSVGSNSLTASIQKTIAMIVNCQDHVWGRFLECLEPSCVWSGSLGKISSLFLRHALTYSAKCVKWVTWFVTSAITFRRHCIFTEDTWLNGRIY